ncbi:hypothetical protein ACVITL_006330 [Rhizobium pisi]|jgi:hypothetical protein
MSNCLYEMIEQPTLLVATSCDFVRMNPFGKVIASYVDPVAGERNRRQKESFYGSKRVQIVSSRPRPCQKKLNYASGFCWLYSSHS